MRISDWSSDVCSSDLRRTLPSKLSAPAGNSALCSTRSTTLLPSRQIENTVPLSIPSRAPTDSATTSRGPPYDKVSVTASTRARPYLSCCFGGCGKNCRSSGWASTVIRRSEEHTSDLQSLMRISYDVCCLQQNTN